MALVYLVLFFHGHGLLFYRLWSLFFFKYSSSISYVNVLKSSYQWPFFSGNPCQPVASYPLGWMMHIEVIQSNVLFDDNRQNRTLHIYLSSSTNLLLRDEDVAMLLRLYRLTSASTSSSSINVVWFCCLISNMCLSFVRQSRRLLPQRPHWRNLSHSS